MNAAPMPAHVRRYLESIGRIDADGITRKARIRFCKCNAIIIRGLDHDRCALAVDVDPAPLTRIAEAEMLLANRHTFDLTRRAAGLYRIDGPRASWRISAAPAGSFAGDVVVEHRCGAMAPSATLASNIAPLVSAATLEDVCPF